MPKKILLADDSITIQKVITITFATEDYDITIVGDGDSAVKKAKELKPDLIMADVAMPGLSGYEVCEAVKKDPSLKHIPVMLLAGTFEPLNKAEADRVKADESIVKPFESQELLDKVATLLSKSMAPAPEEPAEIPAVELEPEVLAVEPIEAPAPPPKKAAPIQPKHPIPPRPSAPSPKAPEPEISGIDEMFGPSGDFLGAEEEPLATPAGTKEFTIGDQGAGFMDLEAPEEGRPEPQRPKVSAPPPPKPEPPKAVEEPEPFGFEPSKEDIFEPPSFDVSKPAEPPATAANEPFWTEPVEEKKPAEPPATRVAEPEIPVPTQAPKEEIIPPWRKGPEEAVKPSAEAPSFAMRDVGRPVVSKVVETAVKAAEGRVKEAAGERLKGVGVSPEKLEDAIAKIAREVIEEIAWEIVPDLAEELIAAEFQRFKEAWAKQK